MNWPFVPVWLAFAMLATYLEDDARHGDNIGLNVFGWIVLAASMFCFALIEIKAEANLDDSRRN